MRLFIVCFVISFSVYAQEPARFVDSDRADKVKATAPVIERMFKEFAERQHLPGLAYGVMLDGKLLYSGSLGFSNLAEKIPAGTKSLFRIASMSKSFTALAILQLRDEGKLSLDDPASKYLPAMRKLTHLTTDAPAITIRHLLTHSAGFPEDNPWGDRQLADSDRELLGMIAGGVSFSNVPGIEYEYSNLGFALLGQIVQVVSGMDFQDYTRERIFKPLGMNSTVWEYEKAPKEKLALGYAWIDNAWVDVPMLHHGSFGAMGGLITSIEDFANYVSLHLSGWPPRSDSESIVLKRSSLREMHQPGKFSRLSPSFRYPGGRECATVSAYGYGLSWSKDCEGRVSVGHGGGLPGFGSHWSMLPEHGIAVMSFDNRTYGGTGGLHVWVLDTIATLAGLQPRQLSPSKILQQRTTELAGILPDWGNAERSGLFAENFFLDNRIRDLKQRSKELFEKVGRIIGVKEIVPENQLRGTFVMEGEKMNLQVFFTLAPEKNPLIQQVRMKGVEK
jgi:CubicO group peptidase (beta-lactamase class C family)